LTKDKFFGIIKIKTNFTDRVTGTPHVSFLALPGKHMGNFKLRYTFLDPYMPLLENEPLVYFCLENRGKFDFYKKI
jgi:hypothetical protein